MTWSPFAGATDQELAAARRITHQALQIVGVGVGRSLIPPRDDDSHTSLLFDSSLGGWWSEPVPGTPGLRAGLRAADLALVIGPGEDAVVRLGGRTLADGIAWLRDELASRGADAPERMSLGSHFEIPDHAVLQGAPFPNDGDDARSELARWFGNASEALATITTGESSAAPVRTWPHHFDIGTLLPGANERSVGVGLSPGDESYPVPYFYVSPYPYPDPDALVELSAPGHWHREGFTAAILTAEHLRGDHAEAVAAAFLREAVAASWETLSASAG